MVIIDRVNDLKLRTTKTTFGDEPTRGKGLSGKKGTKKLNEINSCVSVNTKTIRSSV